eukprot:s2175_g8.t1
MATLDMYNLATQALEGSDDPGRLFLRQFSIRTLVSDLSLLQFAPFAVSGLRLTELLGLVPAVPFAFLQGSNWRKTTGSMVHIEASDFLVVAKSVTNARVRLVCFPHSGGGPSAFSTWPQFFEDRDAQVELVMISAPGRERRVDTSSLTDMDTLVEKICEALQVSGVVDGVPYAFFGHSLGALVAYETARKLDADMSPGRPRPVQIFASGHGGPASMSLERQIEHWGSLHKLSDEKLIEATKTFGVLPKDLSSELLRALLPALRSDFEIYETYVPVGCPRCPEAAAGDIGTANIRH